MKPLTGQRVIDLTQNVAGPYCTQVLADLGADVVKIERPGSGDDTRHWAPAMAPGLSPSFATLNRGKRSLAIDLDHAEGQALLHRVVQDGDIFIHALKPGSAEQRGLGEADLRPGRPGLVYCALSAFGNTGALAPLPGYDPLIQAYAGIMGVNGHEGLPPARVGVSMVDMGTGLWSVIGILAALAERGRTGRGARVDTSLLETGVAWMTNPIANYSVSGQPPRRMGSATAMLMPYEVFEAADAEVFIGCGNDRQFAKLCQALDCAALAADPRYAANLGRVAHRAAVHDALEVHTRALAADALVARLRAAGVPVSRVNGLPQVLADAQVAALDLHRPLCVADGQASATAVGTPLRLDGVRGFATTVASRPGEHSRAVLQQAGLDDAACERLAALGAVGL